MKYTQSRTWSLSIVREPYHGNRQPVQLVDPPCSAVGPIGQLSNEGGVAGDVGDNLREDDHTGQDRGGV